MFVHWARQAAIGILSVLAAGSLATVQGAQEPPQATVRVDTVWSAPAFRAGQHGALAVVVEIHGDYHINPDQSQIDESFLVPTALAVTGVGADVSSGPVQYPRASFVTVGPADAPTQVRAYHGRVVCYVPVAVSASAQPGPRRIQLALTVQACDRTRCLLPQTVVLEATLNVVGATETIGPSENPEVFNGFRASAGPPDVSPAVAFDVFGVGFSIRSSTWPGFVLLLATAGLGGLLLNFTPCVLPVIPLKMMGLAQAAGHRARCLALGLFMSMGVVAFWLVLALMIVGIKGFTATNQLFQYPLFTVAVGVLVAVMAAGMLDVFSVRLPQLAYAFDPRRDTALGSFGLGIMTAILSTPCTAPFMGAAAAWATTQRPVTTLMTFGAIGVGMAIPYLLLGAFPGLIKRVPRTGPASQLIKQVMALLLLAAAAYFVGVGLVGLVASPSGPPSLWYWWPVAMFVGAAGAWLAYRAIRIAPRVGVRLAFVTVGLTMIVGAGYGAVRLTDPGAIHWVYFTPDRFATAQRQGQVIVMDFTAQWCLNCKWLEKHVLGQSAVAEKLNDAGVVAMKVDLTGHNEAGNQMLHRVDRVAIPLLVVFGRDGREVFKSDFYTQRQVIEAVDRALGALPVGSVPAPGGAPRQGGAGLPG